MSMMKSSLVPSGTVHNLGITLQNSAKVFYRGQISDTKKHLNLNMVWQAENLEATHANIL